MKKSAVLALLALWLCVCGVQLAMGESAWVETNKGPLNMRKKANSSAVVVVRVPNGSVVEVVEAGKTWSRVSYQGKEGYVKTQFLKLSSALVGLTVYPDQEYLYVKETADSAAKTLISVHASQAMEILKVEGEWAKVSAVHSVCGEVTGYVHLPEISQMRETPSISAKSPIYAHIELDQDELLLGEELELNILSPEEASYQIDVFLGERKIVADRAMTGTSAYYRPRACGAYRICLRAVLPDGQKIGCETSFTVSENTAAVAEPHPGVFSQKDGWWRNKKYGRSNLEQSGCAIFTLSHALELLGKGSDKTDPQTLARTYPMYLTESGTVTSGLLAAAGRAFGFRTSEDKITKPDEIIRRFEEGAVFSFSAADGHIALAAGLSEDKTMVRIMDSAPTATLERIKNASIYIRDEQGNFTAAKSLDEIPGARYYFETNGFGGLEYYLELSYVARRGVRMILPKK